MINFVLIIITIFLNFKTLAIAENIVPIIEGDKDAKIKKIISKKGEIYSKTLDNWKYLVGKDLFNICYPKSYKKTNFKGKSLNIMVKHGHEVDVEYSKKQIIDKINYYFGYDVVNDIRIKTFDGVSLNTKKDKIMVVTKNKFSKKINTIKNDDIKKSLKKMSDIFKSR